MKHFSTGILQIFILSILLAGLHIPCKGQNFLKHSKSYIQTFDQIESNILASFIKQKSQGKRIVGLGEVSHYTQECYLLKQAIIKSLIQEGFDGLVLEVDFGQALIWNNYLVRGQGNLDSIISASGWFTYRTEEFKSVLKMIREHNASATKPFQIFGMEMTAMNTNLDWLKSYINEYIPENQELLKLLSKDRKIVAFQDYSQEERIDYWNLYYQMLNFFSKNQKTLEDQGGALKYSIAQRITEITRQYATYISQDEPSLKTEFRDQFSYRNVVWCLNTLGDNSRIAIWAHNGHIAKKSIVFNYDILGHYLNQNFGNAYLSIGFTFNQGSFGSFSPNGFKKWTMSEVDTISLTQDFRAFQSPYLIFDIQENLAQDKTWNHPLRRDLVIRTDISEYYQEDWSQLMNINLSKTYDLLIYIDKTHFPTSVD